MGEREAERADAVRLLRAEERKFATAAAAPSIPDEAHERCSLRASTLRTVAAYIERGDHVTPVERTPEVITTYTRAQFAAAVDEAHRCLHEAEDSDDQESADFLARRAHEALHTVGAGQERIACGTMDPEAQAIYADLRALRDREIPCGHTVADLIGGTERGPDGKERPSITKCGACLAIRQPEIVAARKAKGERTPETVLRAMLASYEAAALTALVAYYQIGNDSADDENDSADDETEAERKVKAAERNVDYVRGALAAHLAGQNGCAILGFRGLLDDYRARLRGERPLDAPPLEVP